MVINERVKEARLVFVPLKGQKQADILLLETCMIKKGVIVCSYGLIASLFFITGCKEKFMEERSNLVTMKGNPVTLVGKPVNVGQKAPDFEVTSNDLTPVKFSSFAGKTCIISSVPSLDTSVCDTETRKFNERASEFGDAVILTISMDLPFAQKRWCGSAGIKNLQTLSDYKNASFGKKYGVLIKDLRLLARAVFVVDKKRVVRYLQLVPEIASEPDYDAVLKAVKEL